MNKQKIAAELLKLAKELTAGPIDDYIAPESTKVLMREFGLSLLEATMIDSLVRSGVWRSGYMFREGMEDIAKLAKKYSFQDLGRMFDASKEAK